MLEKTPYTGSGRSVIDIAAVGTWLGSAMQMLPDIAAGLSALWFLIRIYESDTVQRLLARLRRSKE